MSLVTSPGRQLQPDGEPSRPKDHQRQRLILALILFLTAIGVVIYKGATAVSVPQPLVNAAPVSPAANSSTNSASNPAAPSAQSAATNPDSTSASIPLSSSKSVTESSKAKKLSAGKPKALQIASTIAPTQPQMAAQAPVVVRKVLPPLAVEVFAGGKPVPLRTAPAIAVHVDTNGGVQGRAATPSGETTAQAGSTPAPGRVRISPEALQVLSHPVDPNYPMLAREMKVQGSVILDAYIGKDGSIQALKIVSGPTILATAAMEAVRQWRFKPYLQAGQPVETEARITVNFTISTT